MNLLRHLSSCFFVILFVQLHVNAQTPTRRPVFEEPCDFDEDCGGSGGVTVYLSGPSSAYVGDQDYYEVSVSGGSHYSTSYYVYGGSIISQSKTQVRVQWNSAGSSRYVRATANTSSGTKNKYKYVTVNSCNLSAGSIGNAQTLCYNGNPSTLTNTSSASGGSGYSYQWQHRSLGGSWSNISGATGTTYNPPSLTSTKEYRRRVQSCGQTKYTNTIRVTIRSSLSAGSIGNAQTVCYNGNPGTLSNTSSPSGGNGSYSYQWQQRAPGGSWSSISGATGSSYNPPTLTSTKEYRRRVQSCGQTKYSNTVTVTVRSTLNAGSIGNAQTICYNGDPSTLTNASSPSGGDGSYSYQWQQRAPGGSWSSISGATGSSYNPPALTSTKEYRRRVQSCGESKYSNTITVTVQPSLNPGSIANAQTICNGGDPDILSSSASATGGDGNYSYQWQQRSPGGSWTGISGAIGTSYDPVTQSQDVEYRRSVSACGQTAYSNVVSITIADPSTPSTPSVSANSCGPKTLTRATPPSGEGWFWQTEEFGEDVSNANTEFVVSISGNYYLRSRTDGGCWGPSTSVAVTVNPLPSVPSIDYVNYTLDGAILSSATPPAGEEWYWQTSADGTSEEYPQTYNANGPGTYYLRSKGANGCWSEAVAHTITVTEPTNVTTEAISNESILVSWNGNGNETGFSISRATSPSGNYSEVHTAGSTDSEYLDTGLSTGTSYYYRVQSMLGAEKSTGTTAVSSTTEDTFNGDETQEHTPLYNGNISAMRWKGVNDEEEQVFTYSYDGLNRLKKAQYAAKNASGYAKSKGYFSVPDISYDLNGNIQTLTRQGYNASMNADIIDELTYDYHDGAAGNQLMAVSDNKGEAGFNDGNKTGDDYAYDPNGNMTQDLNKGITNIEYNHLNLPTAVILSTSEGSGRIEYLYDAAGIKLQQKVYKDGNLEKTTDYVGEFIYETEGDGERKLQLIQHEEGRIVPLEGETGGEWDYQYHLKDHLGNVRVTFSTEPENYTMVETFETGEENGWQDLHRHTSTDANTTVYEDGSEGDEVELLQSGQTGAMVFLSVNKRDTIHLSVQANYESAPSGNNFLGTAFNTLFTAFDNVYGSGVPEGGGVSSSSTVFDDALNGGAMAGKDDSNTAPRAFLNYIYFDKNMNYIRAGFTQISTAAQGVGVHEEIRIDDIIADEEGYILAYLSNENQEAVNVHFDDFTVYHGKTNVVSTQDYYPFGLTFNSYQRTASSPQNFLLTGNEKLPEWGVGVSDFNARTYDATIGRFYNVDPLADMMQEWTPYHYNYNNPLLFIDPSGLLPKYNWDTGEYEDDDGNVISYQDAFAAHGIDTGGDSDSEQQDPIESILAENGVGSTRDEMLLPSFAEELFTNTINVTEFLLSPSGKAKSGKYIKTLMLVDDIASVVDVINGVEEYVDTRILNKYKSSSISKLESYSKVLTGIENNYSAQISTLEERLNNFPKIRSSDISNLRLQTQSQIKNTQRKLDVVVKEYITINALIYAKKVESHQNK
ncbi:RHS repeat-associated core domain-containing protein [Ekhidna sp.]|uniref:RHS repeat-associated core domain-containing protein n=1 Tax=Ekhidna sp. TaxID=2608089 RepID=UPI003C7E3C24